MFAIWSFLLATTAPDLEVDRRRLKKLVFTSLTLVDIFICFGISLGSHLLSTRILVAVPPSGTTLETSIQESMDLITKVWMVLGSVLRLQNTDMGELVDALPYLIALAFDILL